MIKIEVSNNKALKLSPYAFGTLFANVNEYTERNTPETTFAAVGIHENMTISDIDGHAYKIKEIKQIDDNYVIELNELYNN